MYAGTWKTNWVRLEKAVVIPAEKPILIEPTPGPPPDGIRELAPSIESPTQEGQ
jgi:hypothetical protein